MRHDNIVRHKKIVKAFGGAGLYIDRNMLNHLDLDIGDEIQIEFEPNRIILTKPMITASEIQKLLEKAKCLGNQEHTES